MEDDGHGPSNTFGKKEEALSSSILSRGVLSKHMNFIKVSLEEVRKVVRGALERDDRAKVVGRAYYGDESILMDVMADGAVKEAVDRFYPEYTYISEESGITKKGRGLPYILVDPLDGSTNAKRGISHFCTAIAVAEGPSFDDISAAGVLEHRTGEMVWGIKGAVYNGWRRARPSKRTDLENSVLLVDPKFRSNPENAEGYLSILRSTKYPRMIGAAAWEIAAVATGRAEAVIAYPGPLRTFDCLPSLFLLKEAGGRAAYIGRRPDDLLTKEKMRFVAAGNEELLRKVLSVLKVKRSTFF